MSKREIELAFMSDGSSSNSQAELLVSLRRLTCATYVHTALLCYGCDVISFPCGWQS